jgi:uncharacterized protein YjcR
MHGGAARSGAPCGNSNAVTHGYYTRRAKAERQKICNLVRHSRDLILRQIPRAKRAETIAQGSLENLTLF